MSSNNDIIQFENLTTQKLEKENVICIEPHPIFGLILQFRSVEKLSSGKFSMNSEKIRLQNAKFYGLSNKETELLTLFEMYEPENIMQRYYNAKKRITLNEFFEKHLTQENIDEHIRPFIDRIITRALQVLKGETIYFWGKGNVNLWIPIVVERAPIKLTYHLSRKEGKLAYYVTVKHKGKDIKLQSPNNQIIVNKPAFVIINNILYEFEEGQDAKKILPFFSKTEILVPESAEEMYLNKFIVPIAEEYDLKTSGIKQHIKQFEPVPCLNLIHYKNLEIGLTFKYNDVTFNYGNMKNKVILEKNQGEWSITQINRDFKKEMSIVAYLQKRGIQYFQGSLFTLARNLPLDVFLKEIIPELEDDGYILDQSQLKNPYFLSEPVLIYTVKQNNDWFDLEIKVQFGTYEIPFKKLKNHIVSGNRFYQLPDGSIALLPEAWLQTIPTLLDYSEESGNTLRIGRFHQNLLESFDEISINKTGENIMSLAGSYKEVQNIEAPPQFKAKLRNYQHTGLKWLAALSENNFGGLLADDMGLGKTIQTLAFFEWFITHKRPELRNKNLQQNFKIKTKQESAQYLVPFIVIAPTSLMTNWKEEIERFTELQCFIYSGNHRNRYIWEYFHAYHIIITTYGTLRNDLDVFSRVQFNTAVFDEAQNLKNPTSLSAKAALQLNASQKILLTGTPIENTTTDLWSLMNISNPGMLGTYNKFVKNFSSVIEKRGDEGKIMELKSITEPFILRRKKEQVAKELPPRHEQVVYCEMDSEQEKLYEKTKSYYRNELLNTIQERGLEKSRIYVLKGLLKLRQMSNHPVMADDTYTGKSGKFNEILEKLHAVLEGNNKVLLFSQFVSHLKLFKKALQEQGIRFSYIDGSLNHEERAKQVNQFQKDEGCSVFLISLKAGGVGLNLTQADYVFLADPWWNPAVERQAMDRAHRIGRKNPVFVYKFITENSVEEKIIKLQERKRKLASDLVSEEGAWLANIDTNDLKEILE